MYSSSEIPQKAIEQLAEQEEWYRTTDLPLFGLPDPYGGIRLLGDSRRFLEGDRRGGPRVLVSESYGLAHGDPASSEGPFLQVLSSRGEPPEPRDLLGEEMERLSIPDSERPRPVTATIAIDGTKTKFAGLQVHDIWVLQTLFPDGIAVTLIGLGSQYDGLRLSRITDVEPYIEGRRKRLRSKHPGVW